MYYAAQTSDISCSLWIIDKCCSTNEPYSPAKLMTAVRNASCDNEKWFTTCGPACKPTVEGWLRIKGTIPKQVRGRWRPERLEQRAEALAFQSFYLGPEPTTVFAVES